MKILKKIYTALNEKSGFTLVEAIVATGLVATAAGLAITVFAGTENASLKQQNINEGQNGAMTQAETYLESGGRSATGTKVEMVPVDGNGFAILDNNGAIDVNVSAFVDDGNVQYKAFKLNAENPGGIVPEGD